MTTTRSRLKQSKQVSGSSKKNNHTDHATSHDKQDRRTTVPVAPQSTKRKRVSEEDHSTSSGEGGSPRTGAKGKKRNQYEEKRLKPYRKHAPQTFLQRLDRARTQRMIVVGRSRTEHEGHTEEEIDIVGSTGNIYQVTIGRLPSCSCPDSLKGNECKHKVYALHTVLKAPENLQYQRAFLSSELEEIFSKAPPIPSNTDHKNDNDEHRKEIEGECPICYMDMIEDKEELLWCKTGCGNNMHKSCFEQWAASQSGKTVRCVYCRTDWPPNESILKSIRKNGSVSEDGYINVAERFGISRARDHSSYYQPWVRNNLGYG